MDPILWLKAAILGLVEGLTEFIPVSSTGHLILFQDWLGYEGDTANAFIIFIQLGAILAVVWLYRAKIWNVLRTWRQPESKGLIINLIVATIPAVVVGLPTEDWIERHLFKPFPVALALVVGGIAILLIERYFRTPTVDSVDRIPLSKALGVGLFQVLAIVWPGMSRSGATIMGGLTLGLSRTAATEFSFFLAIPAMLGADGGQDGRHRRGGDAGGHPRVRHRLRGGVRLGAGGDPHADRVREQEHLSPVRLVPHCVRHRAGGAVLEPGLFAAASPSRSRP